MSRRFAAAAALVVALVVVGAGGSCECQLLGAPIRCNPDIDAQIKACPEAQFCAPDGLCRDREQLTACAEVPSPAQREMHVSLDATPGFDHADDAIGDRQSLVQPLVVADVHACNAVGHSCPGAVADDDGGAPDHNDSGFQPLGALAGSESAAVSTRLTQQKLVFSVDDSDVYGDGFTFETVFKVPITSPASDAPLVTMLAGRDGWGVFQESDGAVVLVAGAARIELAAPEPGAWHHVLCTVATQTLAAAASAGAPNAEDAVLCAVDGDVVPPAQLLPGDAQRTLNAPHDLVFGGTVSDESLRNAEVVFARVWPTSDPYHRTNTLDRIDALVDDERARLVRYLGVRVDLDAADLRFLDTNAGDAARLQPIANAQVTRFEIVPGGWPRVAHTSGAGGTAKQAGLLLEPTRSNRLVASIPGCAAPAITSTARVSPDGRNDACDFGPVLRSLADTELHPIIGTDRLPDFEPGTPFTLSVFMFVGSSRDPSTVQFDVEGGHPQTPFPPDGSCTVLHHDNVRFEVQNDDPDCEVQDVDDDWVRVVSHFVANESTIKVHMHALGIVWSPQLEIGEAPTTPLARATTRVADKIVVDGAGLANATSTALRAEVVTDDAVLAMQPLFVAADASSDDHIASLALSPSSAGTEPTLVVVEQQARQEVTQGSFNFVRGKLVRIGADIGTPPIDGCDRCEGGALSATLPAAEQWQQVGLAGAGEPGLLVSADVKTSGTEPLSLALDVQAKAPQSGCLDGERPDVALVACDQGACPEDSPVSWRGTDDPRVEDGPSVDEQAVGGVWTADLGAANVKAVDELYVEVRFVPSGDPGDLVALSDGTDAFTRISVVAGGGDGGNAHVVVADTAHQVALDGGDVRAGEWMQVSCWLGLQSRCVVNAGDPLEIGGVVSAGASLKVVTVGEAARLTAFARVWLVDAQRPKSDIARITGARVASSFGFDSKARRSPFDLVEERKTSGEMTRNGTTFTVGPHWPRIIEDAGDRRTAPAIVYLADAGAGEGLVFNTRDLSDNQNLTLQLVFSESPQGDLLVLDNDDETLRFVRIDDVLHVVHNGAFADLKGLDDRTVAFGARHALLALERGARGPDLEPEPALTRSPMTKATIEATGEPIRLRKIHLGTR